MRQLGKAIEKSNRKTFLLLPSRAKISESSYYHDSWKSDSFRERESNQESKTNTTKNEGKQINFIKSNKKSPILLSQCWTNEIASYFFVFWRQQWYFRRLFLALEIARTFCKFAKHSFINTAKISLVPPKYEIIGLCMVLSNGFFPNIVIALAILDFSALLLVQLSPLSFFALYYWFQFYHSFLYCSYNSNRFLLILEAKAKIFSYFVLSPWKRDNYIHMGSIIPKLNHSWKSNNFMRSKRKIPILLIC